MNFSLKSKSKKPKNKTTPIAIDRGGKRLTKQTGNNIMTPICEHCKEPTKKNGFNTLGDQIYTCRLHTPSWSCGGSGVSGSEPIGYRAMTQSERNRKYRAKKALERLQN